MDNQNKGMSLDEFIHRKLQPVRILVGYLNNEAALIEGEDIAMDRADFDNIISTIEIFIEEYDRVSQYRSSRRTKPKKTFTDMSAGKASIKAIA